MFEKMAFALLSSEWVQTAIIGALVAWLAKWWATETGLKWKKYEGWAITAVKAAEKAIPDDTPNKSWKRANDALLTFVSKYEKATGTAPSEKDLVQIENLLNIVHEALEADGTLNKETK